MESSTGQSFALEGRAAHASQSPTFRRPSAVDGARVHDLIARCEPLDPNSLYCNLLQTSHFSSTCILAEFDGAAVGWVSGYLRPDMPGCLFIWQVAVAPEARGFGLGRRMIEKILARPECASVTRIHTTITASNASSWALFRKLAQALRAPITEGIGFGSTTHFAGRNPTEQLVDIGPIPHGQSGR